jgi:hypothetical protein
VASSHPARAAAAAVPPEFFLFVLLLDFRRRHGLRKSPRQRVAVIGRGLALQKRRDCLRTGLDLILDQRGADIADLPGGASGMLCRDYKGKGSIGWWSAATPE